MGIAENHEMNLSGPVRTFSKNLSSQTFDNRLRIEFQSIFFGSLHKKNKAGIADPALKARLS
jgi:hypothetical protein